MKINGICASGKESSEFNLASPTSPDFKFEAHNHNSEDSDAIETISKLHFKNNVTNLKFIIDFSILFGCLSIYVHVSLSMIISGVATPGLTRA